MGIFMTQRVSIVVPTLGRPSLERLLRSLEASSGPLPSELLLVDDRPPAPGADPGELALPSAPLWRERAHVLRSGGRGPAAARNLGWRAAVGQWIAFLDDDVLVGVHWLADLDADIAECPSEVGGIQGRVAVPLPADRAPTDWERGTAGLASSWWITADMAYRRSALASVGGFDERFPRAYREDADLALRIQDAGARLVRGRRETTHPVRPAPWYASVKQQRGNADDALMLRLHGPSWRARAHAPRGALRSHALTAAAAGGALCALMLRRWTPAGALGVAWAASTARFAWRRIAPGPRDPRETTAMAITSVAIPFAAVAHRLRGRWRHRRAGAWRAPLPGAVFVDRDGTIVQDVPYNGDPAQVRPMADASAALRRLRAAGVPIAVITNQSGVARGMLTEAQVAAVNQRIDSLLGPFDLWLVCPHGPEDGCRCRKPLPGMVIDGARRLGVEPRRCAVIGDIGADVQAARAAGALGILVPTKHTLPQESALASVVARSLDEAVDLLVGEAR